LGKRWGRILKKGEAQGKQVEWIKTHLLKERGDTRGNKRKKGCGGSSDAESPLVSGNVNLKNSRNQKGGKRAVKGLRDGGLEKSFFGGTRRLRGQKRGLKKEIGVGVGKGEVTRGVRRGKGPASIWRGPFSWSGGEKTGPEHENHWTSWMVRRSRKEKGG